MQTQQPATISDVIIHARRDGIPVVLRPCPMCGRAVEPQVLRDHVTYGCQVRALRRAVRP